MSSSFKRLQQFLSKEMRMSHVYQPVMLAELLQSKGTATVSQIARAILEKDPTQLEYYEQITKNMVGQVLTKRRQITSKEGDTYKLQGYELLSPNEVDELLALCREKIAEYEARRGAAIWEHRKRLGRVISGTVRYDVLKDAKFRCVLCGISAEEKALEVDHIIPINRGGNDDRTNLQALCYTCNSCKRDADTTDLRRVAESYADRAKNCPFCEMPERHVLNGNRLAYAIRDKYPVTPLHTLLIPKRHVADYFDLYQPEINAMHRLLATEKAAIAKNDESVTGFNVGINSGKAAGQTIFHCHVHLIPRRYGDTHEPRGGVRSVIPGRGPYGG